MVRNIMVGPHLVRVYIWSTNQHLVDHGVLRYSLGVEYADRLLGELLDALEGSGRFDETLLIVLSDHGVAFSPGEDRRSRQYLRLRTWPEYPYS